MLERRRHPVDILPGRTEAASDSVHCATAFATSFATVLASFPQPPSRWPSQGCLRGRRIGDIGTLHAEVSAWSTDTNGTQRGVDWQLKVDDARCKLKSVYP